MSILLRHPLRKLFLLAAFGCGYVLGAKAGRERYEQIRETANHVKDDPRVQDVVSHAEDILRDAGLKHDAAEQGGAHRAHGDDDEPKNPVPPVPPVPTSPSVPNVADVDDSPLDDQVVYTTGPDIEESIDELIDLDPSDLPPTEGNRDKG